MTKIEKVIVGLIVVCFLAFAGSCSVFISATKDCKGLGGIVEAVRTGEDCG